MLSALMSLLCIIFFKANAFGGLFAWQTILRAMIFSFFRLAFLNGLSPIGQNTPNTALRPRLRLTALTLIPYSPANRISLMPSSSILVRHFLGLSFLHFLGIDSHILPRITCPHTGQMASHPQIIFVMRYRLNLIRFVTSVVCLSRSYVSQGSGVTPLLIRSRSRYVRVRRDSPVWRSLMDVVKYSKR